MSKIWVTVPVDMTEMVCDFRMSFYFHLSGHSYSRLLFHSLQLLHSILYLPQTLSVSVFVIPHWSFSWHCIPGRGVTWEYRLKAQPGQASEVQQLPACLPPSTQWVTPQLTPPQSSVPSSHSLSSMPGVKWMLVTWRVEGLLIPPN